MHGPSILEHGRMLEEQEGWVDHDPYYLWQCHHHTTHNLPCLGDKEIPKTKEIIERLARKRKKLIEIVRSVQEAQGPRAAGDRATEVN